MAWKMGIGLRHAEATFVNMSCLHCGCCGNGWLCFLWALPPPCWLPVLQVAAALAQSSTTASSEGDMGVPMKVVLSAFVDYSCPISLVWPIPRMRSNLVSLFIHAANAPRRWAIGCRFRMRLAGIGPRWSSGISPFNTWRYQPSCETELTLTSHLCTVI